MPKKKKQQQQGLGRQLIKQQNKSKKAPIIVQSTRHTTDLQPNTESILDQSDLDAILSYAELRGERFVAEKQKAVIITRDIIQVEIDTKRQEEMEKNWNNMVIPKRPDWDENTTAEQLKQKENAHFLEWRQNLAKLEQNEHLVLTPFERNPEVWRQLWRVVERSYLVVQIVDARNPLLFRCVDLENWVVSLGKRKLLLVNKADFLTDAQREVWAEFFEREGIEYVFFSARYSSEVDPEEYKKSRKDGKAKIFTRDELLQLFLEECKKEVDTEDPTFRHTVGMVGYPNVGKSSTINVILEEKKVSVSKTPGKTKHFQTLHIPDLPITLCDCPGLVFPSLMSTRAEMICNGLIRIAELREVASPISYICKAIPREVLERFYGLMLPHPKDHEDPHRAPTAVELLDAYGYVRGLMTRHGTPDQSRCGKLILDDFVTGKLIYSNPPPGVSLEEYKPYQLNTKHGKKIIEEVEEEQEEEQGTGEIAEHEGEGEVEGEGEAGVEGEAGEGEGAVGEVEGEGAEGEVEGEAEEVEGEAEGEAEGEVEGEGGEGGEGVLGGINLQTFEFVEDTNPNDHRKKESGRKHKRRQRQKLTTGNLSGAYVAGHKPSVVNYTGNQVGKTTLPTNIILMGGRKATIRTPNKL
eukprot:TRINITY_DN1679_c0_g1_i1.p1 TRINITY_DN1679_c0_g1~~TRINITY_DN1679_c0_g1_i1.p1  ORF type:complete len:637 (+),score=215.20 TRINITY_DN1679_c0_g1_i1:52-1962(+)